MDEPFELTLPVTNINQPQSFPALEKYTVQVTLNHTLSHIRHLIWLFSDENRLKPAFLLFRLWSEHVTDSSKLTKLFYMVDPNNVGDDHGLTLVIDYTLCASPIFSLRDPLPDLFDVEIKLPQTADMASTLTFFIRESLLTSVASIKEYAALRYNTPAQDMDLVYGDKTLADNLTLREILRLDVPPLSTVNFDLRRRPQSFAIRVAHRLGIPFPRTFKITEETTISDLKEDVGRETGEKPGHIEVYFKTRFFSKAGTTDSTPVLDMVSLEACSDSKNTPLFFYEVRSGPLTHFDKETGEGYYTSNTNGLSEPTKQYALKCEHRLGRLPSFTVNADDQTSILDLKTEISKNVDTSADLLELHVRKHFFSRTGGADQTRLLDVAHLEGTIQTPVIFYDTVSACVTNFDEETNAEQFVAEEKGFTKETPSYETYELSLNGKTIELSTSECILEPNNHILLNPSAVTKLAQIGIQTVGSYLRKDCIPHHQAQPSAIAPTANSDLEASSVTAPTNVFGSADRGDLTANASAEDLSRANGIHEIPANTEAFANLNSAFESIDSVGDTNQIEENESRAEHSPPTANAGVQDNGGIDNRAGGGLGDRAEHVEFNFQNQANDNANRNVVLVLIEVINAHRAVIFQLVLQICITMFFMGGGLSSTLFKPVVLIILAVLCLLIAFFMLGIEISDWMDENILMHGDHNLLDHAILNCVSLTFRSAAMLNVRISTEVSKQCLRLTSALHQTRLERLEDEVLGNVVYISFKRVILQVVLAWVLGVVTIFPFLEIDMRLSFEDFHRKEGLALKKVIQKNLQKLVALDNLENVRSLIEEELRVTIETLADLDSKPGLSFVEVLGGDYDGEDTKMSAARAEENEDLLRCHLMLKWFQRNPTATEVPSKLRRSQ